MKRLLPITVFIACIFSLTAQKEANIWYFGHNAGLDFNNGTPAPLTDGALWTDEGVSTISDNDGNLLFYTDGKLVYNKNHEQMPNGYGLWGHESSTQSGVIIPRPGSSNLYYIFTVDYTTNVGGIAYSEVNMDLNGGNGDVTSTKNVQLITPACEKITAVLHANGQDIWVIGHEWESNVYLAWRVTSNGVITTPVKSAVGVTIDGSTLNSIGYLKASPNGDKIAAAHWYNLNTLEVFDFDNSTGKLSNPITLTGFAGSGVYGVEFAPSANLLYASERTFDGVLYQYNLDAGNASAIDQSKVNLGTYGNRFGALQLGPNGKIYVAKRNSFFLGVINNPDEIGFACNYEPEGQYLGGKIGWIGLPTFIQSYFISAAFSFEGDCPDYPTEFTLEVADNIGIDSILWNFGDPNSGANNISYETDPSHTFSGPGSYEVTCTVYADTFEVVSIETVEIQVPPIDIGPDQIICTNDMFTLDATTDNATYLWSDGSTNPTLDIYDQGNYSVQITVDGCTNSDDMNLELLPAPPIDLGADPAICEGESITFDATTPSVVSYLWQNNSTDPTLTPAQAGLYSVTVTDTNNCTAEDDVILTINPLPVFSLGADAEVCEGENYLLDATLPNASYQWQDGSTNATFNVSEPGIFKVEVTVEGCISSDEVVVDYIFIPTVDLGEDFELCNDEEVVLDVFYDDMTTYTWQDNSNLSTFTVSEAGIYSVALENICGSATDEVMVTENTAPTPIDIGKDTVICEGDQLVINATNENTDFYLWNDGSDMPVYKITEPGFYSVTWANECGFATESIEVETRLCECPVVFPNAFSPNEDGNNDFFNTVSPCDYYSFSLKIFSRWGELVYQTDDPAMVNGWDGYMKGKKAHEGVYVYVVEYEHEFDKGIISGDVTLLR